MAVIPNFITTLAHRAVKELLYVGQALLGFGECLLAPWRRVADRRVPSVAAAALPAEIEARWNIAFGFAQDNLHVADAMWRCIVLEHEPASEHVRQHLAILIQNHWSLCSLVANPAIAGTTKDAVLVALDASVVACRRWATKTPDLIPPNPPSANKPLQEVVEWVAAARNRLSNGQYSMANGQSEFARA